MPATKKVPTSRTRARARNYKYFNVRALRGGGNGGGLRVAIAKLQLPVHALNLKKSGMGWRSTRIVPLTHCAH